MLYLGVDIRKKHCWVTVLDEEGHELEQRKLSMDRWVAPTSFALRDVGDPGLAPTAATETDPTRALLEQCA
jgi:hypothetical protein